MLTSDVEQEATAVTGILTFFLVLKGSQRGSKQPMIDHTNPIGAKM